MSKNIKILLIFSVSCMAILILCLAGVVGFLLIREHRDNNSSDDNNDTDTIDQSINSYEDCAAAGYPILETYPTQCKTPDGRTFVENVPDIEDPIVSDDGQVGVRVYFSKTPDSTSNFNSVFAVYRTTYRTDVGTYAIEQLISGPTTAEKAKAYFTPVAVSGTSNCSDKDFSLNIDKTTKVARLKFCKTVVSNGTGDDARIIATINSTLKQFSTVEKVIILTKDNNCFGDSSGLNLCLD